MVQNRPNNITTTLPTSTHKITTVTSTLLDSPIPHTIGTNQFKGTPEHCHSLQSATTNTTTIPSIPTIITINHHHQGKFNLH